MKEKFSFFLEIQRVCVKCEKHLSYTCRGVPYLISVSVITIIIGTPPHRGNAMCAGEEYQPGPSPPAQTQGPTGQTCGGASCIWMHLILFDQNRIESFFSILSALSIVHYLPVKKLKPQSLSLRLRVSLCFMTLPLHLLEEFLSVLHCRVLDWHARTHTRTHSNATVCLEFDSPFFPFPLIPSLRSVGFTGRGRHTHTHTTTHVHTGPCIHQFGSLWPS